MSCFSQRAVANTPWSNASRDSGTYRIPAPRIFRPYFCPFPWHFLNFFPLPQGQGSFLLTSA